MDKQNCTRVRFRVKLGLIIIAVLSIRVDPDRAAYLLMACTIINAS